MNFGSDSFLTSSFEEDNDDPARWRYECDDAPERDAQDLYNREGVQDQAHLMEVGGD